MIYDVMPEFMGPPGANADLSIYSNATAKHHFETVVVDAAADEQLFAGRPWLARFVEHAHLTSMLRLSLHMVATVAGAGFEQLASAVEDTLRGASDDFIAKKV